MPHPSIRLPMFHRCLIVKKIPKLLQLSVKLRQVAFFCLALGHGYLSPAEDEVENRVWRVLLLQPNVPDAIRATPGMSRLSCSLVFPFCPSLQSSFPHTVRYLSCKFMISTPIPIVSKDETREDIYLSAPVDSLPGE